MAFAFRATAQSPLIREEHPLALKIGSEGIGLDYSLGDRVALDLTSFGIYHSAKARFFVLTRNATPYFGVGIGSFLGFWTTSEANKWFEMHAGWEHGYRVFVIQIFVQKALTESNSHSHVPFVFGINFAMRIS